MICKACLHDERVSDLHKSLRAVMASNGFAYIGGSYVGLDRATMQFGSTTHQLTLKISITERE